MQKTSSLCRSGDAPIKHSESAKPTPDMFFPTTCHLVLLENIIWLVVWNIFLFFHILGIIIPTDELIFFRGVETTNQSCSPQFLLI